jgi:hypothetical protein
MGVIKLKDAVQFSVLNCTERIITTTKGIISECEVVGLFGKVLYKQEIKYKKSNEIIKKYWIEEGIHFKKLESLINNYQLPINN